jgi:transcriptional regulator with XRE-family HTH domain
MNLQIKEECSMNAKQIVSEIMKKRGFTNSALAEKLNYPTPSGVSERLRGKQDMRADTLVKFLEAMDCEVIIRSKLSDKSEWKIELTQD